MGFQESTRLRRIRLPVMNRPAGGGLSSIDLPKVGLLTRLYLSISVTTGGTITTQNAYGVCSVINNLRLAINSGLDIINVSGPTLEYLIRDMVDLFLDSTPQSQGRSTLVTATTYNVDKVLPVSLNNRDETGLILLQNEQSLATLYLNWESDVNVILTGGGTITAGTCEVVMEYFEIPNDPKNMPDLSVVHTLREEKVTISGAGDYTYPVPRGNILAGLYHLVSAASTWSRVILRAQQGNNIADDNPNSHRQVFNSIHGRDVTLAGTAITGAANRIFQDFLGSDGLGAYGARRDYIDTSLLTDLGDIVTLAGACEMRTVRRELIPLKS